LLIANAYCYKARNRYACLAIAVEVMGNAYFSVMLFIVEWHCYRVLYCRYFDANQLYRTGIYSLWSPGGFSHY
jgi:hypothetical protein